jgi:hypothetical protein
LAEKCNGKIFEEYLKFGVSIIDTTGKTLEEVLKHVQISIQGGRYGI